MDRMMWVIGNVILKGDCWDNYIIHNLVNEQERKTDSKIEQ